jgi:acetyl-CoA carboxylase biotin carboxyl carrier protein
VTLTAKDVAEITRLLELDGLKLTLRRHGAAAPAGASAPEERPRTPPPKEEPAPGAAPTEPRAGPATAAGTTQDIPAPLLGTFYRAPKPGAPPFVEVGSAVEEDTIIGIIEVMKLMNAVRAGMRGRVADIVAKDGALVEYGETLMRVSEANPA